MSRTPGTSAHVHSDEDDGMDHRAWNGGSGGGGGGSKFEIDHFLAGQEKSHLGGRSGGGGDDPKEFQKELLVDHDFFNEFPDDFDEDDMKLSWIK